jgi:hypothetical protein
MAKPNNTFLAEAKQFGIRRIFFSGPLIIAALLTVLFILKINEPKLDIHTFEKEISGQVEIIGIGIFSILFAAFAIVTSLSDKNFVKFLLHAKVFRKILFPFWFNSCLYLLSVIIAFISSWLPQSCSVYVVSGSVFFVLWALTDTFYVVMATVLFGAKRAEFVEYEPEILEIIAEQERKKKKN